MSEEKKATIPKVVFIVPYRNRPQHKFFFCNYLKIIMEDRNDYEVYFSHQCDVRSFNRGATKNIGFLAMKEKYPNNYKDITFVFNDIDTIPFNSIFNYETSQGTVKHFYGFKYALGGIVSITGYDFERINGFPNFWGWGMEDNVLQKRCEKLGLAIDRSQFFPIGSPSILQLFDGIQRIINRKDPWRAKYDNGVDGLVTIHKLQYSIDSESLNPMDNIHVVSSDKIFIINILTFMTGTKFETENYHKYDLREPPRTIVNPSKIKTHKIDYMDNDWTNIPFYPTNDKKKEMVQKYGEKETNNIIEYSYENSTDPAKEVMPPELQTRQTNNASPRFLNNSKSLDSHQQVLRKIKQYNETMRQMNSNERIAPPNVNKFSPEYARLIASKPKATSSANIRLGGIF